MPYGMTGPDDRPRIRDPKYQERFRALTDLLASAEVIMRGNLRRRYPDATQEELDEHFRAWLEKRDDPPFQGIGRPLSQEEVERRFGPPPREPIPPPPPER